MADIHANGKMTASITVGEYTGPIKKDFDDLVNSVNDGKKLIADAITEKGVDTLPGDSFETMAENISFIQSDDVDKENPYYVEYRVISTDYALNDGTVEFKYGLPRIYTDSSNYTYTYDKVEIILNNGRITDNLNTLTRDIYKIRLWYPENTTSLKFFGNSSYISLVSIIDYINTNNFIDMSYMFYYSNILYIDMNNINFNTSKVTDMKWMFYYCDKLNSLNLSSFDTSNVTNMHCMFNNCTSLGFLDVSNWDTSKVTDMSYMFHDCHSLTSLDLSNFNTSNVTNMEYMFSQCTSLTSLDLSNFDTSNVKDMKFMFGSPYYATGLPLTSLDLSNFNTSNVTSMYGMFCKCSKLTSLDVSNFDTSKVTDMEEMFRSCSSLTSLDLSNFNTSNVTDMSNMFSFGSPSIKRLLIPKWDMTKVTSYSSMFDYSLSDINNLNYIDLSESSDSTITKVVTRLYARTKATYGEMLIPENTSQTIIDSMTAKYWKPVGPIILPTSFQIASSLDEIVGLGKSTKLYYGNYEPWYTDGEVEFISSDDSIAYVNENNELVSVAYGNVEVYGRMKADNSIVSNTLTIGVSETDSYPNVIKFIAATTSPGTNNYIKVNGNNVKLTAMSYNSISKIYTYDVGSPITTIKFNGYSSTSYGYNNLKELIKLNISNVTNMQDMFSNCISLTSLDLSSWDTSKVTNMSSMFSYCLSLTSLDLSNFDTSNVTNMSSMFNNCSSLTSLDLSNFDTSKVTNMYIMFYYCKKLNSLNLSNFDTSKVNNESRMLEGVLSTVDWHYDGTNYQNFKLTEKWTGFSGTFPWNL